MMSLVILLALTAVFVVLAIRNWKTKIGAGPTILIVGFIVVSLFGAVKWNDFQQQLREYDFCIGRVERSEESYRFNNVLVTIIERELQERPDISQELRDALLEPLNTSLCGEQPSFWVGFTEV